MARVLSFPWDTFLQLQAVTDTPVVNARTQAREEALSELLEQLAAGTGPPDADAMEQRYWALATNRAKKYRHRAGLADQIAHHQEFGHHGHNHPDLVALRELLDLISAQLASHQCELLKELAAGVSYGEVARNLGKPVGTLKAAVSRLRRNVCNSETGWIIRRALEAA